MATALPVVDPVYEQGLKNLFQDVEDRFSATELGPDRWYILAIACLAASPDPEAARSLYLFVTGKPEYQEPEARQKLVRRLREALFKCICLVGVCKPIEAVLAISQVERPEDQEFSCTREGWQADEANHERALSWFRQVYTRNATDTMGLFDAHKDFAWVSSEITYGLFLSDRQVLDDLETQLVVLPAIMSQNLRLETHWHIRGTRRIGVSKADTQVVWDAVQAISKFFGVPLNRVPTIDEVESDV